MQEQSSLNPDVHCGLLAARFWILLLSPDIIPTVPKRIRMEYSGTQKRTSVPVYLVPWLTCTCGGHRPLLVMLFRCCLLTRATSMRPSMLGSQTREWWGRPILAKLDSFESPMCVGTQHILKYFAPTPLGRPTMACLVTWTVFGENRTANFQTL